LQELVKGFQEVRAHTPLGRITLSIVPQRRSKITDAEVATFMDASRKIDPTVPKPFQSPAAAE
jgi:hypothetical protein